MESIPKSLVDTIASPTTYGRLTVGKLLSNDVIGQAIACSVMAFIMVMSTFPEPSFNSAVISISYVSILVKLSS